MKALTTAEIANIHHRQAQALGPDQIAALTSAQAFALSTASIFSVLGSPRSLLDRRRRRITTQIAALPRPTSSPSAPGGIRRAHRRRSPGATAALASPRHREGPATSPPGRSSLGCRANRIARRRRDTRRPPPLR